MGNNSSEVDCATLDFPIAKTGGISAASASDFRWYLLRCFALAPFLCFGQCPLRGRAQFTRRLHVDFGFTIF